MPEIKVLMTGVDKTTKGGMWTVAENYIKSREYNDAVDLKYIPLSVTGPALKKIAFSLKGYFGILSDLITRHPDIMHVHMAERGSVYRKGIAMLLGKLFGCRIICHMHGAEFQDWYESLDEKRRANVRRIVDRSDRVIILGRYWLDFMGTIVPKEKISVLYNAVSVPDENRYDPDAHTVLFLGVVGQRKGAYDLLEAFVECLPDIPEDIDLEYYGPDFEGRIKDAIKEKNAGSRIRYMGWLDTEGKEAVFADTICNVLPSYNEGLPMTILETMACGIPNITTDVAAIPEAVDETNGVIISPGDTDALASAIKRICGSRDLRGRLSEKAYEKARDTFSLDTHIKTVLGLYGQVLKRKSK
jgi:glycosyltransferase involved in cell wall biosynthesis